MLLEHLSILNDITAARFRSLWPDELGTFAVAFLDAAIEGDPARGIGATRKAFLAYRDVGLLVDAVLEELSNQALYSSDDANPLQTPILPRFLPNLFRTAWDLRVRARTLNPTDPILVEVLWHLFSDLLVGKHNAPVGIASLDRPSDTQVQANPVLEEQTDLDVILRDL